MIRYITGNNTCFRLEDETKTEVTAQEAYDNSIDLMIELLQIEDTSPNRRDKSLAKQAVTLRCDIARIIKLLSFSDCTYSFELCDYFINNPTCNLDVLENAAMVYFYTGYNLSNKEKNGAAIIAMTYFCKDDLFMIYLQNLANYTAIIKGFYGILNSKQNRESGNSLNECKNYHNVYKNYLLTPPSETTMNYYLMGDVTIDHLVITHRFVQIALENRDNFDLPKQELFSRLHSLYVSFRKYADEDHRKSRYNRPDGELNDKWYKYLYYDEAKGLYKRGLMPEELRTDTPQIWPALSFAVAECYGWKKKRTKLASKITDDNYTVYYRGADYERALNISHFIFKIVFGIIAIAAAIALIIIHFYLAKAFLSWLFHKHLGWFIGLCVIGFFILSAIAGSDSDDSYSRHLNEKKEITVKLSTWDMFILSQLK